MTGPSSLEVATPRSLRPYSESNTGCGCFHAPDVGIRFLGDSLRRYDLTVFCREPEEVDRITLIPEAVTGAMSQRSREKDLKTSPPWYLGMGVEDVLV